MTEIERLFLLYPICVLAITLIDYKLKFFKRHAIISIAKPTKKDEFLLILKANIIEFFYLFVGIYIGMIL